MNLSDNTYEELFQIIMKGFSYKLSPQERSRFAELAGYYKGGRGRPRKDKIHLPRISDADFDMPNAYKSLVEITIGKAVSITPNWKKHRPKGVKQKHVRERQIERFEFEKKKYSENPALYTTVVLSEEVANIVYPTQTTQTDEEHVREVTRYDSEVRKFRRDIFEGHKIVQIQQDAMQDISTSIHKIFKSHSPK